MNPATIKTIASIAAGIAGSVSGTLIAQEPRTLALTLWAVSLASLSTGVLAWVHGPQPGTKAKISKVKQEASKHNRDF
jgi:hypothetical protein